MLFDIVALFFYFYSNFMLLHIILFGFLNFQFKKKNCMKMQIQSIGVQNGGGGGSTAVPLC